MLRHRSTTRDRDRTEDQRKRKTQDPGRSASGPRRGPAIRSCSRVRAGSGATSVAAAGAGRRTTRPRKDDDTRSRNCDTRPTACLQRRKRMYMYTVTNIVKSAHPDRSVFISIWHIYKPLIIITIRSFAANHSPRQPSCVPSCTALRAARLCSICCALRRAAMTAPWLRPRAPTRRPRAFARGLRARPTRAADARRTALTSTRAPLRTGLVREPGGYPSAADAANSATSVGPCRCAASAIMTVGAAAPPLHGRTAPGCGRYGGVSRRASRCSIAFVLSHSVLDAGRNVGIRIVLYRSPSIDGGGRAHLSGHNGGGGRTGAVGMGLLLIGALDAREQRAHSFDAATASCGLRPSFHPPRFSSVGSRRAHALSSFRRR